MVWVQTICNTQPCDFIYSGWTCGHHTSKKAYLEKEYERLDALRGFKGCFTVPRIIEHKNWQSTRTWPTNNVHAPQRSCICSLCLTIVESLRDSKKRGSRTCCQTSAIFTTNNLRLLFARGCSWVNEHNWYRILIISLAQPKLPLWTTAQTRTSFNFKLLRGLRHRFERVFHGYRLNAVGLATCYMLWIRDVRIRDLRLPAL